MNFLTFSNDIKVPEFVEKVARGAAYTSYGDDNSLPTFLYGLYSNSSILQSIINGTADYVYGESFTVEHLNADDLKKAIIDYLIFGGFALQVFYYKGKVYKVEWLDFMRCRKDQDETKVYYSNKWGKYSSKAVVFDMWTPEQTEGTSVFYFKGHKTRGLYPVPIWQGALKSVVISTEISNFHFHNLLNGFNSNFILNFNNGTPDQETQDAIEEQIRDTFCGTDNAGRFMVTWNDDQEHAVTVERIQSDDFDTKYQSLAEFVRQDIFTAFRATPALFGLPNENNGFTQQEFLEAFALYNKTVVLPIQQDFVRTFESLGLKTSVEPFNAQAL